MAEAVAWSKEEAVDVEKMKRMEEEEKRGSSEVVGWERVLPGTVLRVLLVEADDSTRHIISALLRKCNYRVSAVPDGLMAWETLKAGPHNVDLILTEVELPSISGFALLTLVMEHEICKNIPVIMMSSNDSISMVLKCMLKGAADFLIKPVRRNELRNLWQHVWRRHAPKLEASSENNLASSHSSDFVDSTCKDKECCEKQSFFEGLSERKVRSASNLSNTSKEKCGECAELDEESATPTPETEERQNKLGIEIGYQDETHSITASRLVEGHGSLKAVIQAIDIGLEGHRGNLNIHSNVNCCNDDAVETSRGIIDLIGKFDDHMKRNYEQFNSDDGINKIETAPHLELSLRRSCPTSSEEGPNERHILNHSVSSAFSRYNHGKAWQPLFPASTTNCNGLGEGAKLSHEQSYDEGLPDNIRRDSQQQGAISTCSQKNVTTQAVGGQAEQAFPVSVPISWYDMRAGNNHVVTHMYHKKSGLPSVWTSKVSCQQEHSHFPTSTSVSVHNSEQVCHLSDEIANNSSNQDMYEQNKMDTMEGPEFVSSVAGQSATTSLCNGVMDHDIDGAYGSSFNKIEGKSNLPIIDDRGRAPESLDSSSLIHERFFGMDSHRLSQREAALIKFRLKRKERCYEKKVRYQSRKKLAEQRPRVKGQFVRHLQNGTLIADAGSCP